MFQLLLFDLKNRFTSLSTIIYFSVFFVLSFFLALVCGGAFGLSIPLGFSQKLAINSPAVLDLLIGMMGYFGLLIAAPIFGQSINRDFETGFCQVLFATPIRKSTYFFTRYVSAFLTTLMILLSCAFSFWIATMMPFLPPSMVLPNHLWYYVAPYLSSVIPNILFFGAIFLAVVAKSKKMAPYMSPVLLFSPDL